MQNTAAKRYAAALHSLAQDQNITEEVAQQLESLSIHWQEQRDFRTLLTSPRVGMDQKRQLMTEIGKKLKFGKAMANLMQLMLDKGRIEIIPGLAQEFIKLDDEYSGRIRAQCTSARPLTQTQLNALRDKLIKITGAKDVLISLETNPSLLAGFVVSVDGKMIDGSLKGRMQRLGRRLAQPHAETARLR